MNGLKMKYKTSSELQEMSEREKFEFFNKGLEIPNKLKTELELQEERLKNEREMKIKKESEMKIKNAKKEVNEFDTSLYGLSLESDESTKNNVSDTSNFSDDVY